MITTNTSTESRWLLKNNQPQILIMHLSDVWGESFNVNTNAQIQSNQKKTPLYKSAVETMISNRINSFSIYIYLRLTKIHFENGKRIFFGIFCYFRQRTLR